MLVFGHDHIQALEASHNFLCLRNHLSANKTMVLSDYLPNASGGKDKQHSAHVHAQRMHIPHAYLPRKVCAGQQSVCLYTQLVHSRSGCRCISLTANAQNQVTTQASTIACHESEEHNAWLTCSALATPRRVTSCFVTSTCWYTSGSARLSCNPLSLQLLAAALLAA